MAPREAQGPSPGQAFCFLVLFTIATACAPSPGAGYSTSGSSPTPPPALRLSTYARQDLAQPQGVAYHAGTGRLYVAYAEVNRVMAVQAGGTVTLFAGDGTPGFSGDGAPAASARLFHPCGVAVSSGGDVYIADTDNNRIRRVDAGGIIHTVAGDGVPGFAGDGGPAFAARLHQPTCLAIDPVTDDLYVVDARNQRIRRISASSGQIQTVAGDGTPGFSGDGGLATQARLRLSSAYFRLGAVAVDTNGTLWIADSGNHCIRRVDSSGFIHREVGQGTFGTGGNGGLALEAGLAFPSGIAVFSSGDLLISDMANSSLRRVTRLDRNIWHYAGTGEPGFSRDGGVAEESAIHGPMGLAIDEGADRVFMAEVENGRVRVIFVY